MIFGPELIGKVLDGSKTVTRRRLHGRLVWPPSALRYQPGRTYAVQPGRGGKAIGRIHVRQVYLQHLGAMIHEDARLEGFRCLADFDSYWRHLHGTWNPEEEVAVIEFELVE